MNKVIARAISTINKEIGDHGWKGGLYPAVLDDDQTHPDFLPYLWAGHVTWAFEAAWADMLKNPSDNPQNDFEAEGVPDNFDPNVPLNQVTLWAPQDHLSRVS